MKVTIQFDLPDEQAELMICLGGSNAYSSLFQIQEELRGILKWENLTEGDEKAYKRMRNKVCEIIEENDVNLDLLA